ncbi:MAG: hypothetical protein ACO3ZY_10220, partial [Phycisphaerales bacterium]
VVETVRELFECFEAAPSGLHTGLENIGAMFHPAIVVFNAATIERAEAPSHDPAGEGVRSACHSTFGTYFTMSR